MKVDNRTVEDPLDEQVPTLASVLLIVVAGLLSGANSGRALARFGRDAGAARRLGAEDAYLLSGHDVTATRQDLAAHPSVLFRRLGLPLRRR